MNNVKQKLKIHNDKKLKVQIDTLYTCPEVSVKIFYSMEECTEKVQTEEVG